MVSGLSAMSSAVKLQPKPLSLRLFFGCLFYLVGFLSNGLAQTPATVTLSNLVQVYSGAPKTPAVDTIPAGLPTQITFRNLSPSAPASVSEVVYNDSPNPLELSYGSAAFAANQLSALGNLVQVAGNARKLESCEVILVTWARAANYTAWIAANPALANSEGWFHPITISLFEVTPSNQLVLLTGQTQNILIPWRPVTNPDGTPYLPNGHALRANVAFPNGATLPERVMVVVSFRTQSYGFDPTTFQPSAIGTAGPYNELNVAYNTLTNVVTVGTDVDPTIGLQVKAGAWQYPATIVGPRFPMIRIRALSTESIQQPTNAGLWRASARITNPTYIGSDSEDFTIQPATATIQLGNLTQIIDGFPKPVTVVTNPAGIVPNVTYGSSPTPPSAIGTYPVQAQINNPNYIPVAANGELRLIGHSLASWLDPWVIDDRIPAGAIGDDDDPDQDSLSNLLEYAFALNPSTANHALPDLGTPRVERTPGQVSLVYRKNLAATDLSYHVESANQLGGIEGWSQAAVTEESLTTVGIVQTIRASMPVAPGDASRFMRLKVTRQASP